MGRRTELLETLKRKVDLALLRLAAIDREVTQMSKVVDQLVAQVAAQRTVVDGTKTLLTQMFTQLQGAIDTGDVAKVQQALDDLKAQDDELAKAVTDNTPHAQQQPAPPNPQP